MPCFTGQKCARTSSRSPSERASRGPVIFGFAKVGRFCDGFMATSEGWFLRCDNLCVEPDPERLDWQLLPDGDDGLRAPAGPVADEHNPTWLDDGSLCCTYRTVDGHPAADGTARQSELRFIVQDRADIHVVDGIIGRTDIQKRRCQIQREGRILGAVVAHQGEVLIGAITGVGHPVSGDVEGGHRDGDGASGPGRKEDRLV